MKIINLKDINKKEIKSQIKQGKIFIYPTDTIYGIGCNAQIKESIQKIRNIKKSEQPFSVIAPSKKWIYNNLEVKNKKYIKKGPYTFILKLKTKPKHSLTNKNKTTLGVRLPDHKFTNLIKVPFITTSINIHNQKNHINIQQIPKKIKKQVDYIIDQGTLDNKPSTIIDLTKNQPKITKRRKL